MKIFINTEHSFKSPLYNYKSLFVFVLDRKANYRWHR